MLGAPDLILLTLTEFAEQARRICRAGTLPLLCDADHGYGNALNVVRTVEELEAAGVAGLSIEDTELPQPHGAGGRPRLVRVEEGVGKMRAAVAARGDTGIVVAGRTSAPAITGVADAIARARAYAACGVDAIFLVGVKTRADLDAIAGEVRLPLILGGAGPEILDPDYLSSRGVRVCLQGHQPFAAAVQAIHDTLSALRAGTPPRAAHRRRRRGADEAPHARRGGPPPGEGVAVTRPARPGGTEPQATAVPAGQSRPSVAHSSGRMRRISL